MRDLLFDLFGLSISEGAVAGRPTASAAPSRAAVPLIEARLLAGTALASHETGVRVGRANRWLRVFHNGDSAVFVAAARRSRAVVEAFPGRRARHPGLGTAAGQVERRCQIAHLANRAPPQP